MKKIVFVGVFLFLMHSVSSQNYYMTQPEGYGAAATGGGNGTPITVSTYLAFKTALTSNANSVILVSGVELNLR